MCRLNFFAFGFIHFMIEKYCILWKDFIFELGGMLGW